MIKKTIIVIALIVSAFTATAQTKKDTVAKYNYFVKLPTSDIQQYFQLLGDYRALIVYDANKTPQQKVDLQLAIDQYLKRLQNIAKVDSVKITKK